MSAAPELTALARQAAGDAGAALVQLLRLLCEQLGMSVAVLGQVDDDVHTVHLAVGPDGRLTGLEGDRPASESWCARVPADGPLVVRDTRTYPDPPSVTTAPGLGCYVGTTVRGDAGRVLGVLGVVGSTPHTTLSERDLDVLEALAGVVGELYPALLRTLAVPVPLPRPVPAPPGPAPRRTPDLARVADVVAGASGLEELTRPLLEALHEMSGIASTYLTVVHEGAGHQEIRYARNTKDAFALPEGLEVPWADTLCKRALDEGRACTTDVPSVWGDSQAARDLGIVTYVSVPVRLADGTVWGTLCGADDVAHDDAATHLTTLSLFATLIAAEVERAAVQERTALREARTDVLTGCSSQQTVRPWLDAALASCRPGEVVALAHVGVDALAPVNQVLGHAVGDALLSTLGARLRGTAGAADLVARVGGDELVVGVRLPRAGADTLLSRVRAAGRFALPHPRGEVQVRCSAGLAEAGTGGSAADLLARAEAAMRRDKPLHG